MIGGAKAVQFLKNTNLSRDALRTVWALVDSANRGMVDRYQFYKIIRLVAIATSPIYAGSAPTIERYYATAKDSIPLPAITSLVAATEMNAVDVKAESVRAEWVPKAEEKSIIDGWFTSLDPIGSGDGC